MSENKLDKQGTVVIRADKYTTLSKAKSILLFTRITYFKPEESLESYLAVLMLLGVTPVCYSACCLQDIMSFFVFSILLPGFYIRYGNSCSEYEFLSVRIL